MKRGVTLLTGFPRNEVARRVLTALLSREENDEILCLVPQRFQQLATEWLSAVPAKQRARVSTREGDVAAVDMGLSGAEFNELCERIQTIHHCAAVTYTGATFHQAETVNVGGTHEVIELGRHARQLTRLVHWSTLAATGARDGVVYEEDLIAPQGSRLLHTRYRAERLMRRAQRELPITVIRPAMLVGDSRTGQLARVEGAHLLIAGLLAAPRDLPVPRPVRGEVELQVVPIDYAVDAGLTIASASGTVGRTYHVIDAAPVTLHEALILIADLLGKPSPRGAFPSMMARALVKLPLVDRLIHAQRALIDELARDVRYDDSAARPVLARAGLSCPSFSSYVGKLVAHVEHERRGDRISYTSLEQG